MKKHNRGAEFLRNREMSMASLRDAEELIDWHEESSKSWAIDPVANWHKKQAAIIRSLVALVPKDGEIEALEDMLDFLRDQEGKSHQGYYYNGWVGNQVRGFYDRIKSSKEEK